MNKVISLIEINDLDDVDWLDSSTRWVLKHRDRVAAVTVKDVEADPSYLESMLRLYMKAWKIEIPPASEELELIRVELAYHIGSEVSFQHPETGDIHTARVSHVTLDSENVPIYLLENVDPPILTEAGQVMAGYAEDLTPIIN